MAGEARCWRWAYLAETGDGLPEQTGTEGWDHVGGKTGGVSGRRWCIYASRYINDSVKPLRLLRCCPMAERQKFKPRWLFPRA